MTLADQTAIVHAGISGFQLMEAAGQAVAAAITRHWSTRPVSVLCGPGNNGGDGFVVARILRQQGWPVRIGLLGSLSALPPDARAHAGLWPDEIPALSADVLEGAGLVVDALFGAGLSRPLEGLALQIIEQLGRSQIPVCAVDVPSGVDGATGQVLGAAAGADVTVTFFRKKPGHVLLPGRLLCGQVHVADIGIPDSVLQDIHAQTYENHPDLWLDCFPWPDVSQHKYQRGHVLIRGGAVLTGAARLSALAAARAGAGLVTLAVPAAAWSVYATSLLSAMVLPCDNATAWQQALADIRRNAIVIGPGLDMSANCQTEILDALNTKRAVVLDAAALSAFAHQPHVLLDAVSESCVLTPHEGEFQRIFTLTGSKLERARAAARQSGATVLIKGADTVVAAADGRAVINGNAPPELATAGTGDVLSGIIAGLMAQGMEAFNAAAAAVWMHGRAASLAGPGLIADDLPAILPQVLRELKNHER